MYIVNGQRFVEDQKQQLGAGSEGAVHPFPPDPRLCVKLFHKPEDAAEMQMMQYRARKIAAICKYRLGLPAQFITPQDPAVDDRGGIIGFTMRRVPKGFVKISELLKPWRKNNGIGLKDVTRLFRQMIEDTSMLHRQGIIIGDINTGLLMINQQLDHAWVDTDSWTYPGFPCLATTELFCHPDLYPNLKATQGGFVAHQPHHDLFSLTVMYVLIALQGAHPFRMGLHKTYGGALQERARRGLTIFDTEVTYPKILPSPEALSDELLQHIIGILKQRTPGGLDATLLAKFEQEVVACPQCGTEYHASRKRCPGLGCQAVTAVTFVQAMELVISVLCKFPGSLLFMQIIDNKLYAACSKSGMIHMVTADPDGTMQSFDTGLRATKGARYRFFGSCLVVCNNPDGEAPVSIDVYQIVGKTVQHIGTTTTGSFASGSALIETSARFLYRTAGNALMCGALFGGTNKMLIDQCQVGEVYQNQSWFTVNRSIDGASEVIVGFDQALRDMTWWIVCGNVTGTKFKNTPIELNKLQSGERFEDHAVYFSASHVLIVRKTTLKGVQRIHYARVDHSGKVLLEKIVNPGDPSYDCWENISGKLMQEGSILHVTERGIVKQSLGDDSYAPLKDTDGVVTIGDQLLRFAEGICVLCRDGRLLGISKKK